MQSLLKNKSLLWSALGVFILVIGVIVALQLIPQEQDTRQQASVQNGPAQIKFTPASPISLDIPVNGNKDAIISVNTGSRVVDALTAVVYYNYPQATSPIIVTPADITIMPEFSTGTWTCPIKTVETFATDKSVKITVSCLKNGTGLGINSGTAFKDFFKINIKAGATAVTTPIKFQFDATPTKMGVEGQDVVAVPTSVLDVKVTGAGTPPVSDKKVDIIASPAGCIGDGFEVQATASIGTDKQNGVEITFTYNDVIKKATTSQGVAKASFTKAATSMNVTAAATGYTSDSELTTTVIGGPNCPAATATPTPTPGTGNPKKLTLTTEGVSCSSNSFTAKVNAKDGITAVNNVTVTFKYNEITKTAITNATGDASVSFDKTSTNKDVTAESQGYDSDTETVTLPSSCPAASASTTTGLTCNQSCSASRECGSGLTCTGGYCRVARCSTDTTCGCADVNVASQSGTTQLPQSGFDQTVAMTVLGLLFLLGGGQLLWTYRHVAEQEIEN